MLTHIPKPVQDSNEVVQGDIEKFFELFESGYYAEQHDKIMSYHLRWLLEERNEVASHSTMLGNSPTNHPSGD